MQERITSIEIDTKVLGGTSNRVEFCGHTLNPAVAQAMDGKIMKATGLESPTMDVTGGPSSFGGSVYTGLTTNDREVVLTVTPSGALTKSIKNRLNALVSQSMLAPLRLRINTEFGDGTESGLSEDCYITGVSSPIFDADNTLQITVKLPRPFFERDALYWGERRQSSGSPVPESVPLSKGIDRVFEGDRTVTFWLVTEEMGADLLNAPSPFELALNFTGSAGRFIRSVVFRDETGKKATVQIGEPYLRTSFSNPRLVIDYDGKDRTITSTLSAGSIGLEDIRATPGYTTVIEPNWPDLTPGQEELRVEVTYYSSYTRDPLSDVHVDSHTIWPRVFGI